MVTRVRAVNPQVYVVIRQVNVANAASLIDASLANLRFVKSEVVSHKARQLLTSPLLIRFLRHVVDDNADPMRGVRPPRPERRCRRARSLPVGVRLFCVVRRIARGARRRRHAAAGSIADR